ncbi:unnamed protein product [Mytilus edulis]|uniref:Ig-like domain-containing protein n=1 Tax=Mytilus edulis TaxID=6550 RepID=A0A8S3Q7R1_MYTED|nr:unnamed protein product [Mytilus edulis]
MVSKQRHYCNDKQSKIFGWNRNSPSLIISQVEQIDFGYYVCQATDGVDTVNADEISLSPKGIALIVYVPQHMPSPAIGQQLNISCTIEVVSPDIPVVQIPGSTHQVNIGHLITLSCDIIATLQTTVQWLRSINGSYQPISFHDNKYGGSTVTTPHLTILNTDLNDEGYYICTASNSIGTGRV